MSWSWRKEMLFWYSERYFFHIVCWHIFFMRSRSWNRLTKSFKAHCLPLRLQNYHPAKPVESLWEVLWQRAQDNSRLFKWPTARLTALKMKWDHGKRFLYVFFLDGSLCLVWLFGDLLCRNCLSPKTLGIAWTFAFTLICVWRKQKMKAGGRES